MRGTRGGVAELVAWAARDNEARWGDGMSWAVLPAVAEESLQDVRCWWLLTNAERRRLVGIGGLRKVESPLFCEGVVCAF